VPSGGYLYGVDARIAPGQGRGVLGVSLQQIDAGGRVIWSDSFDEVVETYNGSHPTVKREAESVLQSARFLHKATKISIDHRATMVRFAIQLLTSQTFQITDAWLNRWPVR
jgi:hypothetical protein